MPWIFLAISAYFIWSITNLIDKVLVTKYIKIPLNLNFLALFLGSSFTIFYIILFHDIQILPTVFFIWAIIAGAIRVAAYFFYFRAMSREEASRVIILWQITPIFTLIFAYLFVGEKLTNYGYLAFLFFLSAGILASLKFSQNRFRLSWVFGDMILATAILAASTVIMKYIFSYTDFWSAIVFTQIGEIILMLILAIVLKNNLLKNFMAISKQGKFWLLVDELTSALGFIIFSLALLNGSAAITSALSASNPIFVFIFALVLTIWFPKILKEEIDQKTIILKIIAIILMIIGTYILI